MKLHELFPEISLNPSSAKDIKQWILQLAVEGKLTKKWREENPKIENASKLVEKMSLELKELIKTKQVKKEKELESIKAISNNIPKTWTPVRLGNIGDWGAGATPLRSVSLYYNGEINWYKSGELNNGIIDYPSEEKVTDIALKKCSLRMNKPGDVLIAMYGATIGKTGLLKTFGTTNQAVCGCTPYSGITSSFLILLLNALKTTFIDQGEGGAQPNISRVKIRNQIINLPPLEEQKAIVSIVESLFKEVDELAKQATQRIELKRSYAQAALKRLCEADTKAEWQQLVSVFPEIFNDKQTIKTLRETILQLAVQGKLTAKWRSSRASLTHAQELLDQIKAEKDQLVKEKKIKAEKPLPKIEADEIPFELPKGWVWCRFQEIFDIRDGTHDSPKDSLNKITYPLVTSKNFKDGHIDFDSARRISEEDYLKVIQRSKVDTGDILFSMIGGNIGNQVEVGNYTEYAIKNLALFKHYNYGNPAPGFLKLFSRYIAMSLQNEAAGGAQPFVSLKFLRNIVLGLPSFKEQEAIVEKVNALMGLCDELEKEVEKKEELLGKMN